MKLELEALVEKMIAGGILFDEAVKEFEKHFILRVVNRHRNNLSKAAEELGIHRNTLTKRLQEYEQGNASPKNGNGKRRQIAPRRRTRVQSLSK
jgi:Fis family transcriptional regulator